MNIQNATDPCKQTGSVSPGSALMTDTGSVGRPLRKRYSKAAMLQDIVSITDPRMWPVYVAAALVLAIPLYAVFSGGDSDTAVARKATEQQPATKPEPAYEAPAAGPFIVDAAKPASVKDQRRDAARDGSERARRVPMLAPGDQFVLVSRHAGASANPPVRRHLPSTD
jgi:predicted ATPase